MKQMHRSLGIFTALSLSAMTGGGLLAHTISATASVSISLAASEMPRVTQVIDDGKLQAVPRTHLALSNEHASHNTLLSDSTPMNHLQLILIPSVARQSALKALIANQHDPKSQQFDRWLTPQQYGQTFGVLDSDISAVTSWLIFQGFTVNNVYSNKTEIDFSGTAGQVRHAFHTQEVLYTANGLQQLANDSDISVPVTLHPVIAGVMGLNNSQIKPATRQPTLAHWDPSKKMFVSSKQVQALSVKGGISDSVDYPGERGLVPDDMVTMYGIRTIRNNGVTGKGVTIAIVSDAVMIPSGWTNFVNTFNLGQYGGTFQLVNPVASAGTNNCLDPNVVGQQRAEQIGYPYEPEDELEQVMAVEWTTAIAPSANIWLAVCSSTDVNFDALTSNTFGGTFIAATNLINATNRPDIITVAGGGNAVSYAIGESFVDSTSKTAVDQMWAQADVEGISVFVPTGDGGVLGDVYGATIDANALATSPNVTAVGATDLADVLDGTTSKYFAPASITTKGSALSYVPEIPWNESCGNAVAAKAFGFSGAPAMCARLAASDPKGVSFNDTASGGGSSTVDAKPVWQRQVFNVALDQSRDIPDVALFGGSYGFYTEATTCSATYPCTSDFAGSTELAGDTSLSTSMFAGIQALIDQGLYARGLPLDQGNAAPTLYALAAQEYGSPTGTAPTSLSACSADNGATGTAGCVFHNVTRGSTSSQCQSSSSFPNSPCWYYASSNLYDAEIGLTTINLNPTSYGPSNKAYGARPGWSYASGLGSVNATNLLIAWRAFVNAPPAKAAKVTAQLH